MATAIARDVDLAGLNTLRLPARAAAFAEIASVDELLATVERWRAEAPGGRRLVLGGGSNVVLTQDFAGLVLHMAIGGRRLVGEDDEAVYVEAGAGENWHDFVTWTLAKGWPGLENLSLIPGTVGAAPIQNIGAYGAEAGDLIERVIARDLDSGDEVAFDQKACCFDYRDSIFKREGWHRNGKLAIVGVVFRLPRRWTANTRYADLARELESTRAASGHEPTPSEVARAVINIRRRKLPDPATLPNVGSFFQNPVVDLITATKLAARYPAMPRFRAGEAATQDRVKLAAAWMIDHCGWRGRDLGPVGMYEKQALVLVNHEPGVARGTDVGMLAEAVRSDVRRMFGVWLTPEPVFV